MGTDSRFKVQATNQVKLSLNRVSLKPLRVTRITMDCGYYGSPGLYVGVGVGGPVMGPAPYCTFWGSGTGIFLIILFIVLGLALIGGLVFCFMCAQAAQPRAPAYRDQPNIIVL